MQSGPPSSSSASHSFERFLQGWYNRKDILLLEITAAAAENKDGVTEEVAETERTELISRALGLFEDYYDHKSRVAHQDVFSLFGSSWGSPFECAFNWITGFKPAVLVRLVFDSVRDLSPDQTQAFVRLKREIRVEEIRIANDLARIQETVAAPPLMEVIKRGAWQSDNYYLATSDSIDSLCLALEGVVADADTLRVTAAARVVEILSPQQCLRFLRAALQLIQNIRGAGLQRGTGRDRRI